MVRYSNGQFLCPLKSLTVTEVNSSREAPYCAQYALSASLGADQTYYSLACGATSTTVLLLETATNGEKQTAAGYPTMDAGNPAVESDVSNALPGLPSIPNLSSPTGTTSGRSSPSASGSSDKPLSTRSIIVISVVGAGVLLVGFAVGWWCWRRRSKRNRDIIDPHKPFQANYQRTDAGTVRTWLTKIQPGGNPDVPPSVHGSVWGGPSMNGGPRPMATLHE
jgi:hypothetical protein